MFKDEIDSFDEMLVEKRIPFSVIWEFTYRCNHKCIHCYQYQEGEELSLEKIKDILLQLEEKGCLYLTLTGGEPLLREDFWEIAEFAREKNFSIDLFTNGILVNKNIAKRIADLNFSSVQISVLGAREETHDRITQVRGSFKKVIKAIEYLNEVGVRVILKTPLMKENFSDLQELKSMEKDFSVHYHLISPLIFPKSNGDCTPLSLRLTDEELMSYYHLFFEKVDSLSQELEKENKCTQLCYYGKTFCCINPQGEVYPCVAAPIVVGDLRRENFSDIWERSDILEYLRDTEVEDLSECRACQYAKFCYRCGGLAYLEGKGFRGKSLEACRLARINKQISIKTTYDSRD
jgi:radical SAM protein with 4Fe4S-binding SPASM domain